jgi:error-prone DNA polymerase
VRIGGLVVARQRPGTAKGVVFLLIEDETGTVNLIVPPGVYERDRLAVRTEPLVIVDGTLERHPSAGGAINVVVRRLVALDAPDLLEDRPRAPVKDFSPLDERERRRILAEEPVVLAAAGGGAAVGRAETGARPRGGLAAVASGDRAGGVAVAGGAPAAGGGGPAFPGGGTSRVERPGRGHPGSAGNPGSAGAASRSEPAGSPPGSAESEGPQEQDGADDFRAVAPPVMSFAQGRRR